MVTVVKIEPFENGAHDNQTFYRSMPIPNGWALVPDGMRFENFPFGMVEAEEIGNVMTVTKWIPGEIPPEPEPPAPSEEDRLEAQVYYTAMMTDTLLEG